MIFWNWPRNRMCTNWSWQSTSKIGGKNHAKCVPKVGSDSENRCHFLTERVFCARTVLVYSAADIRGRQPRDELCWGGNRPCAVSPETRHLPPGPVGPHRRTLRLRNSVVGEAPVCGPRFCAAIPRAREVLGPDSERNRSADNAQSAASSSRRSRNDGMSAAARTCHQTDPVCHVCLADSTKLCHHHGIYKAPITVYITMKITVTITVNITIAQ